MLYSPILTVHICAGILGLVSGTLALSFPKGPTRGVTEEQSIRRRLLHVIDHKAIHRRRIGLQFQAELVFHRFGIRGAW